MGDDTNMDLPEVIRRTDRLQRDFEDMRDRVTHLEHANSADGVHRDNVERRLSGIEDTLKWITRLIVGGIILGLLGVAAQSGAF